MKTFAMFLTMTGRRVVILGGGGAGRSRAPADGRRSARCGAGVRGHPARQAGREQDLQRVEHLIRPAAPPRNQRRRPAHGDLRATLDALPDALAVHRIDGAALILLRWPKGISSVASVGRGRHDVRLVGAG